MRCFTFPILALISLTALYTGSDATAGEKPNGAAATDDPFAYCLRAGTLDTPDGGGSPIPAALLPYLRSAIGLSAAAPLTSQGYYWRCMDGAVFVCAIGANIPCRTKADRAKRNSGAEYYCRENPDAETVPAYATGHNSIYDWNCSAGHSVRGKVLLTLDHRGYPVNFWHRLSPGGCS
jgi:hypothetical protein